MKQAREHNFTFGRFFGGLVFYPYQFAVGIGIQFIRDDNARLLRLYLGPIKLWVNHKRQKNLMCCCGWRGEVGRVVFTVPGPTQVCPSCGTAALFYS